MGVPHLLGFEPNLLFSKERFIVGFDYYKPSLHFRHHGIANQPLEVATLSIQHFIWPKLRINGQDDQSLTHFLRIALRIFCNNMQLLYFWAKVNIHKGDQSFMNYDCIHWISLEYPVAPVPVEILALLAVYAINITLAGFKPATSFLEGKHSIQLSYRV